MAKKTVICKIVDGATTPDDEKFDDLVEVPFSQSAEVRCNVDLEGVSGTVEDCAVVAQKLRL